MILSPVDGAFILCFILVIVLAVARSVETRALRHRGPLRVDKTGLPRGRVIYSDADGRARPLVARRLPLIGKPDYIVLGQDGRRIPVEFKSAQVHGSPRHSDVLQLATYLVILDTLFWRSPRYGVLHYANETFDIPYTPELRAEVLDILAQLKAVDGRHWSRRLLRRGKPPRGTPNRGKCRGCAFKEICEDAAV